MDLNESSFCTVLDRKTLSRFICYTRRKNGMFSVCLTDAAAVWSTEFTQPKTAEDDVIKLRSSCSHGGVSVVVHGTSAELHVGSSAGDLNVTLSMLEGLQATEELRELLFRMADSLTQLNSGPPSVSPVKNLTSKEFEPRQQQSDAPSVTVKRRLPGASLINPGAKKKLQATGVAFDDTDED